ncbi:DNA primase family protein [Novosphingobium clariflavum]|uniref:Phage/plasmid primase, P4 family n=1 Tax=Novosphingobium clariflavum TaxID=2029884 RepID=A0ABV6S5Y3_9SPHN|nr:DNA primase family protein [Novosphingobium clariflavum]
MIPIEVDDPLELAWFELNDYGNARRLEVLAKGMLKFVDDKYWVAFDGKRWSEREGGFRARSIAHEVAQHIHDEAYALGQLVGSVKDPDGEALKERYGEWCTPERAIDRLTMLHKWAMKSGNASQTGAMLTQARDLPSMRAWAEDFDLDPLTYNVQNGTLRFVQRQIDGKWEALFQDHHEPGDMLMQIANFVYDPDAKCPMWLDRLNLVQPEPEQRAVLGRMYGQTLTGLTDCEEFYVHKGAGGDGKTKTHEVISHGHGDYYRHAKVATFLKPAMQKAGSEHRSDLVRLAGDIRMVICDEPPLHATWDGETLKQVTGGGNVTARGSGERSEITFKPRWKLFVEVNPTPNMPGDDKGFRRRFRLVRWPVDLSKTKDGFEPPAQLFKRLTSELSGIFNWMIAGCLEWLGDRRVPVAQIESDQLADFWASSSPLGEWLAERCETGDREAQTLSKALLEDFRAWMERNDVDEDQRKKWTTTKFGRDLSQRTFIGKKDRRGNKVRIGIRLRGPDDLMGANGTGVPDRPPEQPAQPARDFSADQQGAGGGDPWLDDDFEDELGE